MSEKRTIEIQSFTEVRTAKSGRKYWTLENMQQEKFVCFIPELREHCHIGQTIDAEVELKEGDSHRLENIYVDGKPVYKAEAKPAGRAFGKSSQELAQIKELAEIQNHSIQAQTALNRATDIYIAQLNTTDYKWNIEKLKDTTREFYQLLQSLQKEVIYREKEQSAPKTEPDKEAEVSQKISTDEIKQKGDDPRLARMREYVVTLGWVRANKAKFNKYIQSLFHKASLDELTDEEITTLESSLKEMAELK